MCNVYSQYMVVIYLALKIMSITVVYFKSLKFKFSSKIWICMTECLCQSGTNNFRNQNLNKHLMNTQP